jgi:hypothetical protein
LPDIVKPFDGAVEARCELGGYQLPIAACR